ncbi:methylated-DNA--[protein]-cysteine S-methyltransferase [Hafnia psychrotolerans]|uniref:Methylated-DNA--protein-cysteine methyltransferase n=1 Tax=Hafnia psychrotolerans TaxID=1477018 RepID=A0ABQ1GR69_9GAMM|nr:methylated-DNA--[protein]-cysteine S-methyltransferase [Hafnia psychrotolerans]GGA48813.1 methylated-DNA--protein-cysteine methyltransferase [Hafnia psychrotolerans]
MLTLVSESIETPLGELEIVTDIQGCLRALEWADFRHRMMQLLVRHYGAEVSDSLAVNQKAKSDAKKGFCLNQGDVDADIRLRIQDYFSGDLQAIDTLPVATAGTEFQRRVWQMLRTIPCGKVMTYGQMAAQLGNPGASRAVGLANGSNPISVVVPCHRVIGSNGTLTGYAGGVERKRRLLIHEGYLVNQQNSLF